MKTGVGKKWPVIFVALEKYLVGRNSPLKRNSVIFES